MNTLRPRRAGLLVAALCAAIAAPAAAFDELDALPDGPGREDAYFNCIACHSFQVVTRQGMTRPMWEDTITLMIERHGMFELDPEERTVIVDYLSEHFPASTTGGSGQRGWTNPFAP